MIAPKGDFWAIAPLCQKKRQNDEKSLVKPVLNGLKVVCQKILDNNAHLCQNRRQERRKEEKEMTQKKEKAKGRPPINDKTKALVVRLYVEDEMSCADIAKACNISARSVFRIINERQVNKTENGEKT